MAGNGASGTLRLPLSRETQVSLPALPPVLQLAATSAHACAPDHPPFTPPVLGARRARTTGPASQVPEARAPASGAASGSTLQPHAPPFWPARQAGPQPGRRPPDVPRPLPAPHAPGRPKRFAWRTVQRVTPDTLAGDDDSDADSEDSAAALAQRVGRLGLAGEGLDAPAPPGGGAGSWEWATEDVLREVVARLGPAALCRMRLVCSRWRKAADRNLQELRPCKPKLHTAVAQFPSLTALDLAGCQNVRNRNMVILARRGVKLKALAVGHTSSYMYGRPRITNQGLVFVAALTNLTALNLSDCSAVTNNGMTVLTQLRRLADLAVTRCPRIADTGLAVCRALTQLTSLNIYGCTKVTHETLAALAGLPRLARLQLGFTRVADAGAPALAALTGLTELAFFAEEITSATLAALTTLTNLAALGLSNCCDCSGLAIARLAAALPCLRCLNCQNCELQDEHLSAICKAAPGLERVDLAGTRVGAAGLAALAGCRALRTLGLQAHCQAAAQQGPALAALTQLHSVQLVGGGLPHAAPALLAALPSLPRLTQLDAAAPEGGALLGGTRALPAPALAALTACTRLQRLDLSHTALAESQVEALVAALPRLACLCLHGCPLSEAWLAALAQRCPAADLHTALRRRPTPGSVSSTSLPI